MAKWKVYQVYQAWEKGGSVYKVGRLKDENKPVENSNIEWKEDSTTSSWAGAAKLAFKLNKEEEA